MNPEQDRIPSKVSHLGYVGYIGFSYLLFISIIAIFGRGFGAAESLAISFFACSVAVVFMLRVAHRTIFRRIDFLLIGVILLIQSLVGIIHFDQVINPDYFYSGKEGVDITDGTYYWDVIYFVHLVNSISELKIEQGYFSFAPLESVIHKNYVLAYLVSDLFYFGDAYVLNFSTINLLSSFYSAILLSLLADHLFENIGTEKRRMVFYLSIIQPIAWVPSHTMRDVFGAFIIILAVSLLIFSVTKIQRVMFGFLSLFLVFQHRSAYFISMIGVMLIQKRSKGLSVLASAGVLIALLGLVYIALNSSLGEMLVGLLVNSHANSMLSGAVNDRNANIFVHFFKLIIGPFPWTQYYDGSVEGYASFYSTATILQAAWHLSIIACILGLAKTIIQNPSLRNHLYIVLLFALPAVFSLGGMNFYLLPALMLALVYVQMISAKKFILIFIGSVNLYFSASALYFFSQL